MITRRHSGVIILVTLSLVFQTSTSYHTTLFQYFKTRHHRYPIAKSKLGPSVDIHPSSTAFLSSKSIDSAFPGTNEEGGKKKYIKERKKAWIDGPPPESKPDYDNIHGPLGPALDKIFLIIFRSRMAEKIGMDSNRPRDDYEGLMELAALMNSFYSDRREVQIISQDILRSLFPSWLPRQFGLLFAKPFPEFSCRLNAWATKMAGTWLMGECEINDCDVDGDGGTTTGRGRNQGLLVKRCRFLEESGCASVCINSCKIPTQKFFEEDMGLPLTMTPDYETGECQFSFGLTPDAQGEFDAKNIPCLSKCPTAGELRMWHTQCSQMENDEKYLE